MLCALKVCIHHVLRSTYALSFQVCFIILNDSNTTPESTATCQWAYNDRGMASIFLRHGASLTDVTVCMIILLVLVLYCQKLSHKGRSSNYGTKMM